MDLNERNVNPPPRIRVNNYPGFIPAEARPQGLFVIIVVAFIFLMFIAHSPTPWDKSYRRGPRVRPSPCCCGIDKTVHKDRYFIANISKDVFSLTSYRNLDLLIAVHTLPEHFSQREAIRQTWANSRAMESLGMKLQLVFFVGKSSKEESVNKLRKESGIYNDLVALDMKDDEANKTLKSVAMLAWVDSHCPELKYLMKLEDDVYLNLPLLEEFLEIVSENKTAIFGRVKKSDDYKRKYPIYVDDSAYIMTGDIIRNLCRCCLLSYLLPMEDAYVTGLCARLSGVHLIDEPVVFSDRQSIQSCNFTQFISIDDVTPLAMKYLWRRKYSLAKLCPPMNRITERMYNRYKYTLI